MARTSTGSARSSPPAETGERSRARAMAMRWRSPPDSPTPREPTSVSSPSCSRAISPSRRVAARTDRPLEAPLAELLLGSEVRQQPTQPTDAVLLPHVGGRHRDRIVDAFAQQSGDQRPAGAQPAGVAGQLGVERLQAGAQRRSAVSAGQQRLHPAQRQPQRSQAANPGQAHQRGGVVAPVAALVARWLGHQAAGVAGADRLDGGAQQRRRTTDRKPGGPAVWSRDRGHMTIEHPAPRAESRSRRLRPALAGSRSRRTTIAW